MARLGSIETNYAVLRKDIIGSWPVDPFIALLNRVKDVYLKINALDFFVRAIQYEDHLNAMAPGRREFSSRDVQIRSLFFGIPDNWRRIGIASIEPSDFETLSVLAIDYTGPLYIRRISFASPGWIELFGSLNPLKVMADAIAEWRRQNTERENNLAKAEIERLKIRTQFTLGLLRWYESLNVDSPVGYDRIAEIEQKVLRPTEDFVDRIAGDSRILAVSVLPSSPSIEDDPPHVSRRRK